MKLFFYELYKLFKIKAVALGVLILITTGILSAVFLTPEGVPENDNINEDFLKYINTLSFETEYPLNKALNEYDGQKPDFDTGLHILGDYFRFTDYNKEANEAIKALKDSMPLNAYYSDGFLGRALLMHIEKYEELKNSVKLQCFLPFGIELLTKNNIALLATFLSVALASLFISCNDKQSGMSTLIFTTKNGRIGTAALKLSVIFAFSVFSVIIISLPVPFIGESRFSLGNLSNSIQSLDGFLYSTLNITVGEYLVLFLVIRIFALFLTGAFIYLMSSVFKSALTTIIATLSVGAVEVLLYYAVPDNSVFNIAKRMNVAALFDANSLLSDEAVISFFGTPVMLYNAVLISLAVIIALVIIASILLSLNTRSIEGKKSRIITRLLTLSDIATIKKSSSLKVHEVYKTCFTNKALAISLLAVIASVLITNSLSVPYDKTDYAYRNYIKTNGGYVTEETIRFIEAQKIYFSNLEADYFEAQDSGDYQKMSAINKQLEAKEGFFKFASRAESIYNSDFENAQLIYETGFEKLIGTKNSFTDSLMALIAVFLASFLVLPMYATDNKSGMLSVISSTVNGRRRLYGIRSVLSLLLMVIVFITVYSPQFLFVTENYVIGGYDVSVKSLEVMSDFACNMTISQYLIMLYAVRFTALCVISMLLLSISASSQNILFGILKSTGLLILPIALTLIVPEIGDFWITAYICGNAGINASIINIILTVIIATAICTILTKRSRYPITE